MKVERLQREKKKKTYPIPPKKEDTRRRMCTPIHTQKHTHTQAHTHTHTHTHMGTQVHTHTHTGSHTHTHTHMCMHPPSPLTITSEEQRSQCAKQSQFLFLTRDKHPRVHQRSDQPPRANFNAYNIPPLDSQRPIPPRDRTGFITGNGHEPI